MNTDKENILNNLERIKSRIKEITEELKCVDSWSQWKYYNQLKSELKSLKNEKKILEDLLKRI